MDLHSTYNQIAEEWFEQFKDNTWWTSLIDDFTALLKPGASILDVGCGPGITAKYLTEKGFDVTGIDFSESMIDIAKREVPTAHFQTMDIRDLPSMPQTFAGIVAQAILLHFPKKEVSQVLQNLKDRLAPGGYIYIAVKEMESDGKEEKIVQVKRTHSTDERFFSFFTMDELKKDLTDLDFEIIKTDLVPKQKGLSDNWLRVIARK